MNRRLGWFIIVLLLLCAAALAGLHTVYPIRYSDMVSRYAGRLEPSLIYAVIHAESKFRPEAVSGKGAVGLMQLTEATAKWMADEMKMDGFEHHRLTEPAVNIALGCRYLNWLADYYKNDMNLALCAYNAGPGNVNKWLGDERYSKDGKTLDIIPFPETSQYVQRVEMNKKAYDFLLLINLSGD
jgi:soluble lytic murein transglycosylase